MSHKRKRIKKKVPKKKRNKKYKPLSSRISKTPSMIILDSFSVSSISKFKIVTENIYEYFWKDYSELAHQRSNFYKQIHDALSQSTNPFRFNNWQRLVRYQFSFDPLSTKGSLLDPGGRFNIGEIDFNKFPIFPGLYLASDKQTAMEEVLGQDSSSELTAMDQALSNEESIAILSVSGCLDSVIDLNKPESLRPFVEVIKNFTFSDELKKMANSINIPERKMVETVVQLVDSLLDHNWQAFPWQFNIPANSQIFGHMASTAGIQGIVYPSKMTNKNCLVVFTENKKLPRCVC